MTARRWWVQIWDVSWNPRSLLLIGAEMKPLCRGWGSKPIWNGSHIHSKHIKGAWQPSYALDGAMDPSSCHYHHTCQSRFGMSAESPGHCCLLLNETFVYWLRLQTQVEWFSHPLQTYKVFGNPHKTGKSFWKIKRTHFTVTVVFLLYLTRTNLRVIFNTVQLECI